MERALFLLAALLIMIAAMFQLIKGIAFTYIILLILFLMLCCVIDIFYTKLVEPKDSPRIKQSLKELKESRGYWT